MVYSSRRERPSGVHVSDGCRVPCVRSLWSLSEVHNYSRNDELGCVEPGSRNNENKVERSDGLLVAQWAHAACGVPSLRSVCNSTCLTHASRGERV